MDRGAWWSIVHGVAKEPDTTEVAEHTACEGWREKRGRGAPQLKHSDVSGCQWWW